MKIELTHRCSLNCAHCSSDAHPGNPLELPYDECIRILREAAAMGAEEVAFSGGEPMIWIGVAGAVQEATRLGLSVSVYTSGNVHNSMNLIDSLIHAGARRFMFSLFGAAEPEHERVTRTRGSFSQTLQALQHAHSRGVVAEVHFVPLASNYRSLPALAALCRKLGVDQISVLRFVPQGRGSLLRDEVLTRVQNLHLKRMIEELREQGSAVRTGSPYNFLLVNEEPACKSGIDRMIVRPDGRICPCDAFKQILAEEVVGTAENSIVVGAPVAECWDRSPYLGAVRGYLTSPFAETCDVCHRLEDCLSGCLAQKVLATGTLSKTPDPDCLLNPPRSCE